MQTELSSQVDDIIDVLRSNQGRNLGFEQLHSITGTPIPILRKWINVLEEHGLVRICYNFSNEEFTWVGNGRIGKKAEDEPPLQKISKIKAAKERAEYSQSEISLLLEDIKAAKSGIDALKERKNLYESRKSADNATMSILGLKLEDKKKRLAYLLLQARKLANNSN